ncbi:MAG: TonB-dependent receptor [Acidobacteria bacterium]|nr:MAG: TonB-dependent receptor [Acidobacteriota bacterium]
MPPAVILSALVLLSSSPEQARSTGAVRLVVLDSQGATVSAAKADVVCGSAVRHASGTAAGVVQVAGLPAGACKIIARASGFSPAEQPVNVKAGDVVSMSVTLNVSSVAEDVLVSATRGVDEQTFWLPESTSITTRDQMNGRPYSLMPQVLREEVGIEVQQTTSAQTSPIIRGFTGQSNAYLVDGVRFNTSSWRSGPSQYTAWLDAGMVNRLDVVRGPGSVQFGSDALGGTINVRTWQPSLTRGRTVVHGSMDAVAGSADRSGAGNGEIAIQGSRAAIRFGANSRTVGDLRAGGGIDSHAAVVRFLGLPATTYGPALRDTGFEERGGFAAGTARLDARSSLSGLYVRDSLTGSSRYDRIYGGDGVFRSGFDPQTLDFGYIRYQRNNSIGLDTLTATVSVNRQKDGRFEQTRPTTVFDHQASTTLVRGYAIEGARRVASRHLFSFGGELFDEKITASRAQDNPVTGASTPQRPDIPTGTTYLTLGAYLQDVTEIIPGRLIARGGVRLGRYTFDSVADAAFFVPAETVVQNAFTYNAGLVASVTKYLNATFTTSRGFRAANAADLGDIGLSGGGGFGMNPSRANSLGGLVGTTGGTDAVSTGETVPALRPEVLYSHELGLKLQGSRMSAAVSVYDTEYMDSIQRRAIVFPTSIVGQTISGFTVVRQDAAGLAYIAQDARPIGTRVNLDHARIQGLDASAHVNLNAAWSAAAYFSTSNGKLLSTGENLRRMLPPMGGARLRFSPSGQWWVEGTLAFARTQTRMNAGDLTDARIGGNRTRTSIASFFNGSAVDLGLVKSGVLVSTGETLAQVQTRLLGTATAAPVFTTGAGWVTVGLRGGVTLHRNVTLTVIGENLTDKNYRVFGSGLDAPGRNVQTRLSLKF